MVDFGELPVGLLLAELGGVGAALVLAGGVLSGDLSPLLPVDLGGVLMMGVLARLSSSLGLRPRSAAVF